MPEKETTPCIALETRIDDLETRIILLERKDGPIDVEWPKDIKWIGGENSIIENTVQEWQEKVSNLFRIEETYAELLEALQQRYRYLVKQKNRAWMMGRERHEKLIAANAQITELKKALAFPDVQAALRKVEFNYPKPEDRKIAHNALIKESKSKDA